MKNFLLTRHFLPCIKNISLKYFATPFPKEVCLLYPQIFLCQPTPDNFWHLIPKNMLSPYLQKIFATQIL